MLIISGASPALTFPDEPLGGTVIFSLPNFSMGVYREASLVYKIVC